MKALITGASSFTGCWFARALADAGHDVLAVFTRSDCESYEDVLRRQRVQVVEESVSAVEFGARFGDDKFMDLVREFRPALLCHHAADVTNYKSPDFDYCRALANNTARIREVLSTLVDAGGKSVMLTGSVFEGGEGAGSEGLPNFSPYGLSKALTAEVFRYFCAEAGVPLGKFVIPNPFGPLEEPRFTAYLVRNWKAGETPKVNTPAYVRDNIHVSLLAKGYLEFAESLIASPCNRTLRPSGYIESQGAFAQRFARELRTRLDMPCELELANQVSFDEPRIRINTDPLDAEHLGWDETAAWDAVAEYYR